MLAAILILWQVSLCPCYSLLLCVFACIHVYNHKIKQYYLYLYGDSLRAVATAEKVTASLCRYAPLTLLVPHSVSLLLSEQKSSHLSASRWLWYHTTLLEMPNITVKHCTVLNPATLFPSTDAVADEPHDCASCVLSVLLELTSLTLLYPTLTLFCSLMALPSETLTLALIVWVGLCALSLMSSSLAPYLHTFQLRLLSWWLSPKLGWLLRCQSICYHLH